MERDDPRAGPWVSHLRPIAIDARQDFASLHQYLRVVGREVGRRFEEIVEDVESRLDPEMNDMGDVYWEAEKVFGANPLEIDAHTGLMLVSRAVALSEIVFASIPSVLFVDAEPLVYRGNHSWSRKMAKLFYQTCLARPVAIGGGVMAPITQLRDLYAHGYGRPHRMEEAESLAAALHPYLGPPDRNREEEALGFKDAPYAFGRYAAYDPASGFKDDAFVPVVAELSPVATRRLLLLVEHRVEAVLLAASWGLKNPLNETTSKFVREWMKEEAKTQAEEAAERQRIAEKSQRREAALAERAEKRRLDHEAGLARQAELRRKAKQAE